LTLPSSVEIVDSALTVKSLWPANFSSGQALIIWFLYCFKRRNQERQITKEVHPNPAVVNAIEIILLRETNAHHKTPRPPEVSFGEWIDIFTASEVNEA
jgi:hypothetical protein